MNWISEYWFELIIFGIVLMSWIWSAATRKKRIRKIAMENKQVSDTTFHSGYRYSEVELKSFRHLDFSFYEQTTEAMKKLGFERIADVEYLHVSEGNPDSRTCVRIFASDTGDCYGAAFHMRIRGWKSILLKCMGGNPNMKIIEFNSSLSNGHCYLSVNLGDSPGLSHPDEIHHQRYPFETPPAMLLDRHRETIGRVCHGGPDAPTPILTRTLEEIIEQEKRQHEIESKFRSGIKTFTKEELRTIAPNISEKELNELVENFEDPKNR